jgi:hypothetical protein
LKTDADTATGTLLAAQCLARGSPVICLSSDHPVSVSTLHISLGLGMLTP